MHYRHQTHVCSLTKIDLCIRGEDPASCVELRDLPDGLRAVVLTCSDSDAVKLVLKYWTALEATAKLHGAGLQELPDFEAILERHSIFWFEPLPSLMVCVATRRATAGDLAAEVRRIKLDAALQSVSSW
jgi:hypothetical protein